MHEQESVTQWMGQIEIGDKEAAQKIWDAYFPRLAKLAANRLNLSAQQMADGEDVALSALDLYFRRAKEGDFAQLEDRDSLWRLLSTITNRKAISLMRKFLAQKNGGGKVRSLMDNRNVTDDGLAGLAIELFGPELKAVCEEYLDVLDDDLKKVTLLRIEGYSNEEIGKELNISERSVDRRILRIKKKWRYRMDENQE